jgi:DNA invertase Pin-like site-specific DNA recombinase
MKRAIVWSGVSSQQQVEDRDSLSRQRAEGESLCASRGWVVVANLEVPGATREYIDLQDAIEGLDVDLRRLQMDVPNAYRELSELIAGRQFDVLVCRDRSRLGRTDSLIAGIDERVRRAGATVYSMAMPPTGARVGDLYVSAIERASAQHEMERLKERRSKGLDDRLRRGLTLTGGIPFPYVEQRELRGGKPFRLAIADPEMVSAYLWTVDATLNREATSAEIGEKLRALFPQYGWAPPRIRDMLKNVMPVGLILRRRIARDGETPRMIVYESLDTPYWQEIEKLLYARYKKDSTVATSKAEAERVWLLMVGQHEAVIQPSFWLELQQFLDTRSEGRRPPSRTRIWSGLLWCARCGAHMYASTSTKRAGTFYGSYVCSERLRRKACSNPQVPEDWVTGQMIKYLEALRSAMPVTIDAPTSRDPAKELARQQEALVGRRERITLLYETGRIDINEYDRRISALDQKQAEMQDEMDKVKARLARASKLSRSMSEIAATELASILQGDRAVANRWLRSIISRVWIDNRVVVSVEI